MWLHNAKTYAADVRDRRDAAQVLQQIQQPPDQPQGQRVLRTPMNALARIRWFAPAGVGIAGRLANRALNQVVRYLTDPGIRHTAQQRLLDLIDADTDLVIAHSLGTVVAYEALHTTVHPLRLITLGSPLALRHVIYDRLHPNPAHVPVCIDGWDNFVDLDDLVAAHTDLTGYFPPAPLTTVTPITGPHLDNGSAPHDATHYLTKRSVGQAAANAILGSADPTDK